MEKKNTWETYDEKRLKKLEKVNKEYREFLDNGKTERECIDTIVNTIEAEGYRELESLIREGHTLRQGIQRLDEQIHCDVPGGKQAHKPGP